MKYYAIGFTFVLSLALLFISGFFYPYKKETYSTDFKVLATVIVPTPFVVTHLKTPEPLKAIYMSSWVAGNQKFRDSLVNIIDNTELNAVVIDIKDYTGRISFLTENPKLKKIGSAENRIPDIKEFIGKLHEKGIYVIGRISVFQDSYLVNRQPEYAVKTKSGEVWKDFKSVKWLDAGAMPVWEYIVSIGREAHSLGFDELNFDYIRFPSDGNMNDISYPFSEGKIKADVLNDFFAYIDMSFHKDDIPISADLFGMTTSNKDDLGIGQILENALSHFDYVSPMVYPSHYPPNFNGWANPASKPYEVVSYALSKGKEKAIMASTTSSKIRPWLQDFSINSTPYNAQMVRAQIQATYDVGFTSWMLWSAANTYTVSALETTNPQ
ncbi:MAG: putative glycoside hydrolase [Patescibacteria group bacterium]